MVVKLSDNIISPLGISSTDNLKAIVEGRTALSLHENVFGLIDPVYASLFNRDEIDQLCYERLAACENLTLFERLVLLSATESLAAANIDPSDERLIIILSSTKGNVDLLDDDIASKDAYIGHSAAKIAKRLGNPNIPVVVSNACISGVSALTLAYRFLSCEKYRYALVVGCDILSKFIVSGFQSFKALSQQSCRPFDKDRIGLNLGEASASVLLGYDSDKSSEAWNIVATSNHNDANHISGPSRTGEGAYRVLKDLLTHIDVKELAFVNLHGTATPYNDEMESIAMHRADLEGVPANALKGYLGHTLGAAGIVESILSMMAADNHFILPTKGFDRVGTSYQLNISNELRATDKTTFFKILSGFGGSNAGIAFRKGVKI